MKKNAIIALLSIALMLSLGFGFVQKAEADAQRKITIKYLEEAIDARQEAQQVRMQAEAQAQMAQKARQEAVEALRKLK